ncbi:hypothetical protein [Streptomyces sp. NBC_01497]|uniref:hypothetical protein n=1 Tax=Streptomyces sp. NBC_01497 TaxID=2903885 RepID=UPI002E36D2D5|nr:hypothetical protein [Streptomyces sp. NBC_01497]
MVTVVIVVTVGGGGNAAPLAAPPSAITGTDRVSSVVAGRRRTAADGPTYPVHRP